MLGAATTATILRPATSTGARIATLTRGAGQSGNVGQGQMRASVQGESVK
jgi:hypothetical protein